MATLGCGFAASFHSVASGRPWRKGGRGGWIAGVVRGFTVHRPPSTVPSSLAREASACNQLRFGCVGCSSDPNRAESPILRQSEGSTRPTTDGDQPRSSSICRKRVPVQRSKNDAVITIEVGATGFDNACNHAGIEDLRSAWFPQHHFQEMAVMKLTTLTAAMLVMFASVTAQAGWFGKGKCCETSCCAPSCAAPAAQACCAPAAPVCCAPKKCCSFKLPKLSCCKKNDCCAQSCCAPVCAPRCCAPAAPRCCAPAAATCCAPVCAPRCCAPAAVTCAPACAAPAAASCCAPAAKCCN